MSNSTAFYSNDSEESFPYIRQYFFSAGGKKYGIEHIHYDVADDSLHDTGPYNGCRNVSAL